MLMWWLVTTDCLEIFGEFDPLSILMIAGNASESVPT